MTTPPSARSALNPAPWLVRCGFVMSVLAICGLAVDFGVWGPIREWAWQTWVVTPVERTWGFHAEWRTIPESGDHLVITTVALDGSFAAAGIKPGAVIPHPRCAWYAWSGGFFGTLSEAKEEASVRLILARSQYPEGVLVTVQRRRAT